MTEGNKRKAIRPSGIQRKRTESAQVPDPFEKIVADLRALLASEFERGAADAASRILQLVAANDVRDQRTLNHAHGEIRRAPRGAARTLVEKALAGGAKNIRQIRDQAETSVEKFLSYQTVRLELERGLKQRKYKKIKDKWILLDRAQS